MLLSRYKPKVLVGRVNEIHLSGLSKTVAAGIVIARLYVPHMRHRGELKNPVRRYKPKKWVVERSASWLNRFMKLLV